jgi:hypothetical protein
VATDAANNVYAADNDRVVKFASNGNYITTWGSMGSGTGQLNGVAGIATDQAGNVYVAEQQNNRISVFDTNGTFLLTAGSTGSGDGQFNSPFGIATDTSGSVYVADTANHRIQKFACPLPGPSTTTTTTSGVVTSTSTMCVPSTTTTTVPSPCGGECVFGCGTCAAGGFCLVAGGMSCGHLGSGDVCVAVHSCQPSSCTNDIDCSGGMVCAVAGTSSSCCSTCP